MYVVVMLFTKVLCDPYRPNNELIHLKDEVTSTAVNINKKMIVHKREPMKPATTICTKFASMVPSQLDLFSLSSYPSLPSELNSASTQQRKSGEVLTHTKICKYTTMSVTRYPMSLKGSATKPEDVDSQSLLC